MILRRVLEANWVRQGVKFGMVGVFNTALDIGLYTLLTRFSPFFAARQTLAKMISYTVGVINSFFWNRNWTFRSKVNPWRAFLPFLAISLVGVGVNAGVFAMSSRFLPLPAPWGEWVALALATGASLVWNFIASKKIVFRK